MNIEQYENKIIFELKLIVETIIKQNITLPISAKSRAGAEISNFLEDEFVKITKKHNFFKNSESAPKGQTKNPWDAKTYFEYKKHIEEIWIDFKAIKISSADSNPDIGTPTKIIKFIKEGGFYLVYIYVYYQEEGNGLKFVNHNGSLTKIYFLKDISPTFRRNPKNQLQVNISKEPQYRSREEFIELLLDKLKASHERQIEISKKELLKLDSLKKALLQINKVSENKIKNLK